MSGRVVTGMISASQRAAEAARVAKAERETALLGAIRGVASLYPNGIISARDGWIWRELADVTGATEGELTRLAADAGFWPWNSQQIARAVRDGTDDGEFVEGPGWEPPQPLPDDQVSKDALKQRLKRRRRARARAERSEGK